MPYADGVPTASTRVFAGVACAALALAASQGCGTQGASQAAPTAPGASRGTLPAALATSPVVATREWRWKSVQGIEVETRHWSIRSSLRSAAFTATLPAFYEAALRHYRTGLVDLPVPARRLESCVFGTRDEWARYAEHRLGDDAATYLRMGRGGFTSDGEAVLYFIGQRDTLTIAAHEGWHQYSQTTLRNALPVWLEEGIACYMEGFRQAPGAPEPSFLAWRNPERFTELRAASRQGRIVPLRALLEGSPQSFLATSRDAQLGYYAQAWALVHYIRDGEGGRYREGLERLLADAVAGSVPERIRASPAIVDGRSRALALSAKAGIWLVLVYLDDDYERFERGYAAFVDALVASNSWDRVMRGESPLGDGLRASSPP